MKYGSVYLSILVLLNPSIQSALMGGQVKGHVVPPPELKVELSVQAAQRIENIQEVQTLLHQELVRQHVRGLVDLEKVERALTTLDDETLKMLAFESQKVNDQIEAGMATWGWVAIAAIAAFVIIVIVAATAID